MQSLHMVASQRQTQSLSPRLQHAVRLLQMSSLDFAALVRDAMGNNPFLETEDGEDDSSGAPTPGDGQPDLSAEAAQGEPPSIESDMAFDDGDNDRDMWHADGAPGLARADDSEFSAMDLVAVATTLNAHLHTQLNVLALTPRDLTLARTLVESLDDDGYLRTPLEDLLEVAGLEPVATLSEMQSALQRVQLLDPAGVGARSVGECLLLQMPEIDCPQMRGLAHAIVEHHLHALASRDVLSIARDLGAPPAQIELVCDRIRRLDPRPGWRLGSTQVTYVVPDVLIRKHRGQWTVQLNPAIVPKVRFNQVYAQLFQRHRTAQHGEMNAQLQEARWTVQNVEQRFSTILDVAQAIVKRQRGFLDYGPMAMKPMGLREIADEIGVHESTVSRVTNNKYMATPSGVYELKYFFSRAMISSNGSACSGTAIRGLIKDVIEAEHLDKPLSDAEITRQLAQQGLVVARRTVTKYRQMLKIEAVGRRRRHG